MPERAISPTSVVEFRLMYQVATFQSLGNGSQGLPIDNGTTITVYQRMIFGGTGETLYFGTAGPYTAADEAHCYLYALDAR